MTIDPEGEEPQSKWFSDETPVRTEQSISMDWDVSAENLDRYYGSGFDVDISVGDLNSNSAVYSSTVKGKAVEALEFLFELAQDAWNKIVEWLEALLDWIWAAIQALGDAILIPLELLYNVKANKIGDYINNIVSDPSTVNSNSNLLSEILFVEIYNMLKLITDLNKRIISMVEPLFEQLDVLEFKNFIANLLGASNEGDDATVHDSRFSTTSLCASFTLVLNEILSSIITNSIDNIELDPLSIMDLAMTGVSLLYGSASLGTMISISFSDISGASDAFISIILSITASIISLAVNQYVEYLMGKVIGGIVALSLSAVAIGLALFGVAESAYNPIFSTMNVIGIIIGLFTMNFSITKLVVNWHQGCRSNWID